LGTKGTRTGIPGKIVLDAGDLIAYERGNRQARALVREVALIGEIVVPSSALAQAWRGGPRSAPLAPLLEASTVDALDEGRAKEVGTRLGARGATDVADAHVVCTAVALNAEVATSDTTDIQGLAEAGESLRLIAI